MPGNDSEAQSGYDFPVYGLGDSSFYALHVLAISCISLSLTCASITLAMSFTAKSRREFFDDRQKRNRFVVYMAFCDGLFNVCHLADHFHVLIGKDHVYPKKLCVFYAFDLLVTMLAQNLLVNVIAVNAFALMYFNFNLNFGKWDWRLHAWIFGVPLACAIGATAADTLGPSGAYCFFDAVKGTAFYLAMMAIPVIVIMITNMILYLLTWLKLRTQTRSIRHTIGQASAGLRASHRAAKSMALFVLAYIVQWWALACTGFWAATGTIVPKEMIMITVFFTNIGGILNLVVFIIIRRSKPESREANQTSSSVSVIQTAVATSAASESMPMDDGST